jgi:hypothetical protein
MLAREAEHRCKNILATVQAIVNLSQDETVDGFKRAIEGRIQALANMSRAADRKLTLRWTESGGPPPTRPTRKGFGMSVIQQMIREEGEIHLDWRSENLKLSFKRDGGWMNLSPQRSIAHQTIPAPEKSNRRNGAGNFWNSQHAPERRDATSSVFAVRSPLSGIA